MISTAPKAFANSAQGATTPQAFANFQPKVGAQRQPWVSTGEIVYNPEGVRQLANPFRVHLGSLFLTQGCRWCSNPGLELANAFGVGSLDLFVPPATSQSALIPGLIRTAGH